MGIQHSNKTSPFGYDTNKAVNYLTEAAHRGFVAAYYSLYLVLMQLGELEEASQALKDGADKGHAESAFLLGNRSSSYPLILPYDV